MTVQKQKARTFPPDEFHERRRRVRALMQAEGIDALLFLEMSDCVYRYHALMGRLVFIDR
jgi:hypothetical protein